jgi:hypothetical protein
LSFRQDENHENHQSLQRFAAILSSSNPAL